MPAGRGPDGFIGELIPPGSNGIHCTAPVEVAAGNDPVAFRERWGRQMAIPAANKRALARAGDGPR